MKTALVLALLLMPQELQAHTTENALFVCEGVLTGDYRDLESFAIEDDYSDTDNRPFCYIDKKVIKQILKVCTPGKSCTVSAKGESGNGGRHLIQKVFEVQRNPGLDQLREDKEREIKRLEHEQTHTEAN